MINRLVEIIQAICNITAVARTATTPIKGTAQDVYDCEEVVALVVNSAMAATTTVDVKLQESDTTTDGDFTDITGAAIVQLLPASANVVAPISVRPTKKYLRSLLVARRGRHRQW